MERNVKSIEIIKPSAPTSSEHKIYKLCLFDGFQQNTYFPLIIFYHKTNDMEAFSNVSRRLKNSLSEALTIFYPLGGRRSDIFSIDCKDEGAIYMEASINMEMSEFLSPPKLELMNKLLPCEPNKTQPYNEVLPQILVQVNHFNCGGIAIGLCNLHTILDAHSCSLFLKTWSSICNGSRNEICEPNFSIASSYFPLRNTIGVRSDVLNVNKGVEIKVECSIRRFLFDNKLINEMKKISKNDGIIKPTSYKVVSSFICKHMIVACIKDLCDESKKQVVNLHVVDIRRRMGENVLQNSIGNLIWPATVVYDNVNKNTNTSDMVKILEEEIGNVNEELFLKVKNDPSFLWSDVRAELTLEKVGKNPILFVFTSWGNMGFKEIDFGWGKPLWIAQRGVTKEAIPNQVVLMETYEGIEAWVTMAENHLDGLENNIEFLKFALHNPNINFNRSDI
ncbi:putative alcohol O-acetyltransferase [Medicago truncatula]|uniref:Alcohol acyltransferase n=2 Tax=Medicago truncatula TaxID=3880 RepID=A0A072TSA0_MEDTR|nr:alcohol acyltransferase [Medicago truncatula]RHN41044.1 putative alcohol O-acetyltransferase [Medicago truncatula]